MKLKTLYKFLRPRYLFTSLRGRCSLCGNPTRFILTDVPETIRNHAVCFRCGSSARHRHLALCVLREYKGKGIRVLADFRRLGETRILNTSSGSPVAKALGRAPNIICSEFFDGAKPGEIIDGVRNEDLQNLTFADGSLDLILSEDVFEHIPDVKRGFREVHRVLKSGGLHIFTIPFYFDRVTEYLFDIRDGKPFLREPIEYHGDPKRGTIPAFTRIGYDMLDYLREIGFEVSVEISRYAEYSRFATYDCYTLISRKR